jgi:hypothetical protein
MSSSYLEEKITYYEKPGLENTEDTLRLAVDRARARGITKIVVASTRGYTARMAANYLAGTGIKMVAVPHQYGFGSEQRFPSELVAELEKQGHRVHFGTMLFLTDDFYGLHAHSAKATLVRTFCQGMKVCIEVVLMATDGGCIAIGEKVIAIGGTGSGSDTAVVAIAAPSIKLNELHVTEIICKPFETQSRPVGVKPAPETTKPDIKS